MKKLNDIEVIINGKRYNLRGYESEEYLQKVASYINSKHTEFKNQDAYRMLDAETRTVLLDINIADDYFKILSQVHEFEKEIEITNNEVFELKHELISLHSKLDTATEELEASKRELAEAQKTIIRLETELKKKR